MNLIFVRLRYKSDLYDYLKETNESLLYIVIPYVHAHAKYRFKPCTAQYRPRTK